MHKLLQHNTVEINVYIYKYYGKLRSTWKIMTYQPNIRW